MDPGGKICGNVRHMYFMNLRLLKDCSRWLWDGPVNLLLPL